MMAYTGRLCLPLRGTLFRLQVCGKVRISLVKVYESGERTFVILVYKKAQKDLRMHFMAVKKSIKRSGLRFIHVLKKVHLQQLKGMQSSKLGM